MCSQDLAELYKLILPIAFFILIGFVVWVDAKYKDRD